MLGGKSRSQQVEVIKQLIRQNKYKHSEKTFEQCLDRGISVNLESLSRFSEKLELLDRAERKKKLSKLQKSQQQSPHMMTYEQVKQRETEITFELGELKIRESKLLEELNSLSKFLDTKEFN